MPSVDKKVVLIADDDFYMRELAKTALSSTAQVVEADSGSKAVELYKQHNPAIVFLDIHMPGKNGKNTLEEVLKHDPEAYVIMLSADSSLGNVKETHKIGAKGFIAKPFTKDVLMRYIDQCPRFT